MEITFSDTGVCLIATLLVTFGYVAILWIFFRLIELMSDSIENRKEKK